MARVTEAARMHGLDASADRRAGVWVWPRARSSRGAAGAFMSWVSESPSSCLFCFPYVPSSVRFLQCGSR